MPRVFGFSLQLAAALLLSATAALAQSADTVLFNGKILTVDKDFSVQQAIAIGNGRILENGTKVEIQTPAAAKTEG